VALLQGRQGRRDGTRRIPGLELADRRRRGYSSLATLLATALGAASAWWFSPRPVAVLAAVLVVLVWAKHHENIRRLLAGTESKVGGTKSA